MVLIWLKINAISHGIDLKYQIASLILIFKFFSFDSLNFWFHKKKISFHGVRGWHLFFINLFLKVKKNVLAFYVSTITNPKWYKLYYIFVVVVVELDFLQTTFLYWIILNWNELSQIINNKGFKWLSRG